MADPTGPERVTAPNRRTDTQPVETTGVESAGVEAPTETSEPPGYASYTFGPEPPPRPSLEPRSTPPVAAWQALPRPISVTVSFWLWVLATVVAVITAGFALTQFDRMRAGLVALTQRQDVTADQATVDQVATVALTILIGVGVVLALLQLGGAALTRQGKTWARVTLAVLGAVGVFYAVLVWGQLTPVALGPLYALVRAALLGYVGLVVLAAVVMFLPGARPWFERPRPVDGFEYSAD